MDKQFFICHSTRDSGLAKALLEELEASGYKCWLSSRDVKAGSDREKTVYGAILESAAVLLVFSENATDSHHIRGELEIAANVRIPIVPLKFREADLSESIRYYTDTAEWIDCTAGQSNTPGISETLLSLVKEKKPETPQGPGIAGKLKWIVSSAILLFILMMQLFWSGNTSKQNLDALRNITVGGRDSWDYASDVVCGENGVTILSGAWDRGLWSEIWVVYFDNSGNLISSWSDSVTGESMPHLLATSDSGCLCVYSNFSDADDSSFAYRVKRMDRLGDVSWETQQRIGYKGTGFPEITSLNWLSENTAIAGITIRGGSDNDNALFFAKIDTGNGFGETFEVQGDFENQCTAVSCTGEILLFIRDTTSGSSFIRVFNQDGMQENMFPNDQRLTIHCALGNPDGSIIAAASNNSQDKVISIMKFSSDFEIEWENAFEDRITGIPADLTILSDGSIVLTGSTDTERNEQSDALVIFLDKSGKLLQKTVINSGADDHILSVTPGEDGIILLSGSTTCFGNRDAWLVEMNTDGEYNQEYSRGMVVFSERWSTGFIPQESWMVGSAGTSPPEVISDTESADPALTLSSSPVLLKNPIKLTEGLCFSAEITTSDFTADDWVSIGTAESYLYATNQEAADCEFRWNYGSAEELVISSSRVSPGYLLNTPVRLVPNMSQQFTIENYADSVFFLINDSLIAAIPSMIEPDSLRLFINGNSTSGSHLVDNIRIYRRNW